MKMAVIADVHGNLPALKAVFSALDLRKDIKHIYCLGFIIFPFLQELNSFGLH